MGFFWWLCCFYIITLHVPLPALFSLCNRWYKSIIFDYNTLWALKQFVRHFLKLSSLNRKPSLNTSIFPSSHQYIFSLSSSSMSFRSLPIFATHPFGRLLMCARCRLIKICFTLEINVMMRWDGYYTLHTLAHFNSLSPFCHHSCP